MGNIFYLAGIFIAGYFGASGFDWFFLLIGSILITIGYFIIRAPQMHGIASREGPTVLIKIFIIQIAIGTIIAGPAYFIGSLFN